MMKRFHSFLTGLLALLVTLTLGLAPSQAKTALGGYQLFEQAQSGIEAPIQLASLGNFDWSAKTASDYANAPNNVVPDGISFGRNANQDYHAWRHIDKAGLNKNRVMPSREGFL